MTTNNKIKISNELAEYYLNIDLIIKEIIENWVDPYNHHIPIEEIKKIYSNKPA